MFSSPLVGEIEKLIDANVCRVKLEEDDETRRIEAYFKENKRAQLFSSFGISPKIAIFIYENYEDLISHSPWSDEVEDMYIKFLNKHGFRHDPKGDWGVGEAGYIDKCLERIKNGPDSISHKQAEETEARSLEEIIAESGIKGFGQAD